MWKMLREQAGEGSHDFRQGWQSSGGKQDADATQGAILTMPASVKALPLAGRRALVTGAARGIGAAIARRLAEDGARVVAGDLDPSPVGAVPAPQGVEGLRLGATDVDGVRAAVEAHGPFDILVNNAGLDQHGFFTDTQPADWQRLLSVNLLSVFACTHAVLPAMQAGGFGRIICISSEAARLGSKGSAVYAAAKGGMLSFMRSIARENARYRVTANAVAPGPTRTPMLEALVARSGPKLLDSLSAATLLGRLGEPEEVAAAVAFLASDGAAFITGETIGVSGGMGTGA